MWEPFLPKALSLNPGPTFYQHLTHKLLRSFTYHKSIGSDLSTEVPRPMPLNNIEDNALQFLSHDMCVEKQSSPYLNLLTKIKKSCVYS